MVTKIRDFVKAHRSDIFFAIAIVCITIISFNAGRMVEQGIANVRSNQKAVISNSPKTSRTPQPTRDVTNEPVYASKASSSRVYHFSWCSGAKRIAEKNKLTFPNEAAAKAAGYALAGNCQK